MALVNEYIFFDRPDEEDAFSFLSPDAIAPFRQDGYVFNHAAEYIETYRQLIWITQHSDYVWQRKRYDIMRKANVHKFIQNPTLKALLLQTKNATLVYASSYDRVYGIGYSKQDAASASPYWGANLFGKVLMDVRAQLSANA